MHDFNCLGETAGNFMLNFLMKCQSTSKVATPFYILSMKLESSPTLVIIPLFFIIVIFGYKIMFQGGCHCIFLVTDGVKKVFIFMI